MTFTIMIDAKMASTLDQLRQELGKSSKSEIIRFAIALLKVASEERNKGNKITIANQKGKVIKEILFPG